MKEEPPVIVVGAGIVGVSAALYLRRAGRGVTLVDPHAPGSGASSGNAGCFNLSSTVPVSMPGVAKNVPRWLLDPQGPLKIRWRYLPRLAPWLVRFLRAGTRDKVEYQARALRALILPALEDVTALARSAGAGYLVKAEGHLVVYRSEEAFRADALGWHLRDITGTVVEEWDGATLRDFDPAIADTYAKGIFIAENGHTPDPAALVARMAEQFVREGGVITRAAALGFERAGGMVTAVRTDAGVLPASAVLLAAGAHSRKLAAMLGDRVPLDTERGYHLMIRDPEAMPRISILDTAGKFVATPMAGGLRLAGTVELAGLDAPPDWRRADMLLGRAKALFPALAESYPEERLSRWMGFRPSMPDSLPVLGRASRMGNAFHAFGHGHIGLTAGATSGRIAAEMMCGATPAIDMTPYRVDRF
ncbi:FAD-dependent oxidoreductase [Sphingobium sp. 22B]|uniref:NAD(P)/FAD-dependent oxidoreductase n=1 Tax=unclassified Sphingobium TaxID=2611147 RepID=UPI0007809F0B|nr:MULTISPECIES: FAD-dependent oxidoreductase [unclassified Sphingobium]KXU31514.1 FAD-dependent oxidoreductase [Sphingobium sp. AM]KYC31168.1 FAD-dependent oxidoreductase [Sphingobium sp. 22B]OAP31169.1 FAD-dependent oxidoreductase [Sphingobium sp. 20006FA]